jgi:hypothetical protein
MDNIVINRVGIRIDVPPFFGHTPHLYPGISPHEETKPLWLVSVAALQAVHGLLKYNVEWRSTVLSYRPINCATWNKMIV